MPPVRVAILLLLALAACEGSGTDLGPRIAPLGSTDYRVVVADDQGRAVCGARVTVSGLSAPAATGRLGRARVPGRPAGAGLVTADGSYGSATSTDRLGSLTVAATLPDGDELPYPLFLPDLSASAALTLPAGTLLGATSLDDSASSGAVLTLPAGMSLAHGAASTVTLRTGKLAPEHLPGTLPLPSSGARLLGRGASIDPPLATFAPAADLSLPNDLGLAAGDDAELWRLDPASGQWSLVGAGQADLGAARITAAGAVAGGGLYAFALPVPASTTLTGRVVDNAARGIPGVLVRGPGVAARSDGAGQIWLGPLAATDALGNPLTIQLELVGGRDWRPSRVSTAVPLTPGTQALPDLVLETTRVGLVRLQMINQGRIDPGRRLGVAAAEAPTFGLGIGDAQARIDHDDIAQGTFFGVLTSRVKDPIMVHVADAVQYFPLGQHHADVQVFGREQPWWSGRRSGGATNVHVVDQLGSGPIRYAVIVRGSTPGQGFVGLTRETGVLSAQFGTVDQATAAIASGATGRTVYSACTLVDLDSNRIEIPLERARPRPSGAFDPHGLVAGQLTGSAGAGKERRVRSTRPLVLEDWYEEVLYGRRVAGDVPVKVDPRLTGGTAFELGVPAPQGHLAAIEGTTAGPAFTLERAGFRSLTPVPGGLVQTDLALDLPADTTFTIQDALTNLHPTLAPSDLAFDLATQLADGTLFDVARGVNGGIGQIGTDVRLQLPGLAGALAGARHWIALGAVKSTGGKTIAQHTVTPLAAPTGPFVRFLDVPDIVAPAPGATVPAAGFQVDFTVPISTLYLEIELRAETAADTRVWTAVLPASFQSFTFRTLPPEAPALLQPGLSWTLRVTAARVETGPLQGITDAYRRVLQNWVGIGPDEREVNALSSTTIQITTM